MKGIEKYVTIKIYRAKARRYTKDSNGRYIFSDAHIFLRPDKTIIDALTIQQYLAKIVTKLPV